MIELLRELKYMLERLIVNDVLIIEFNFSLVPLLTDPALTAVSPHLVSFDLVMSLVPCKDKLLQEALHWVLILPLSKICI